MEVDQIRRRVGRRERPGRRLIDEREKIIAVDVGDARVGRSQVGVKRTARDDAGAGVARDGRRGPERKGGGGDDRSRRRRRRGAGRRRAGCGRDFGRSGVRPGREPALAGPREDEQGKQPEDHHSIWYRAGSSPRTFTTIRPSVSCTTACVAAARPGASSSRFSIRLCTVT